MPTYTFKNEDTGCIEERIMSFTKLDQFKKDNPHLKQVILSAPPTTGGVGDRVKIDGGFKEVLSKIGDAHPGSSLNTNKSIKDIKTKEVVKKHIHKQRKK